MRQSSHSIVRPLALAITTALSVSVFAVPFTASDAGAASIKIKPQTRVTVNPKVKIKPRVRVVAKPRIRVKPRIRIVRKKPDQTFEANPAIAKAPASGGPSAATGRELPRDVIARADFRPAIPATKPAGFAEATPDDARFGAAKDVADAARAVEAAREALFMSALREAGAAELGLPMPDLVGSGYRSNRDILGMPEIRDRGFGFGTALGGSSGIGGPANSHGGEAPANPWGVTPGSIANAVGGIAGNTTTHVENGVITTKTVNPDGSVEHTKTDTDPQAPAHNGVEVATAESSVIFRNDGLATTGRRTVYEDGFIVESSRTPYLHGVVTFEERGGYRGRHSGPRTQQPYQRSWRIEPGAPTQMVNPDYAGRGGCQSMDCILRGGAGPTLKGQLENSPTQALTAAPDQATAGMSASGGAAVSQEELLSLYDPDSIRSGEAPPPIDDCHHSEC